MHLILSVFWCETEQRLRSFWRIGLHMALTVLLLLLVQIFQVILGGGQTGVPNETVRRISIQVGAGVAVVFGSIIAAIVLDRRPLADLGFHFNRTWWMDLVFGLVLGAGLMAGIFLVQWAAGWITIVDLLAGQNGQSFLAGLIPPLVIYLAVGIYEELFFRGYQLVNMAEGLHFLGERTGIIGAWAVTSVAFGILHYANPNASLVSTVNLALAGLFLGLGPILTGQLAIAIGIHITWNFFQGNVFGFPVSGARMSTASVVVIDQGGPTLWTGGEFGPEAGLIGLVAMLIGGLITLAWIRWRDGRIALHRPLSRYSRQGKMATNRTDVEAAG